MFFLGPIFGLQGLTSETQGWHLKRLLTFTKNRLCNRPHRPRDPLLRAYMDSIGVTWPEPPQATRPAESGEESDSSSGSDEDETESEDSAADDVIVDPVGGGGEINRFSGTILCWVQFPVQIWI